MRIKLVLILVLCSILTLFLVLGCVSAVDMNDNSFINNSPNINNTQIDDNHATDIDINLDKNSDEKSYLEKDDNNVLDSDSYLNNESSNNKESYLEDTNFLIHPNQYSKTNNPCYDSNDAVFEFDCQKIWIDDLININYKSYIKNDKVTFNLKNGTNLVINQVEPFDYDFIFYKNYKEITLEKNIILKIYIIGII